LQYHVKAKNENDVPTCQEKEYSKDGCCKNTEKGASFIFKWTREFLI
jgi:hypothetical protein